MFRVERKPVVIAGRCFDRIERDVAVQVDRILATAPKTPRAQADVKKFHDYRPVIEAFINAAGTTDGVAGLP